MYAFYNKQGIGDVLLFPIKSTNDKIDFERKQDIVKIMDRETNQIIGYNIFQASTYFASLEQGKLKVTESLLSEIKHAFQQNGVEDDLELDLSPKFVVGHVQSTALHENADKLKVCKVDVGTETLQIVCGAPNVQEGQKVVVAKVGAIMPSGMEIKESNLRGIDSFGMICSQKELGIPNAPKEKGIYVLNENMKIGEEFQL
ncbi:YtpR family tRNA-binding protein [Gracilibacillus dipsosauri]|uniref:DUF4479 domain-containing protein n=1 Tax=Gracilibacillus dipsosauri TaxID=178340 RepID=A0A317L355_9BACI|nr:DUF4479 family protein [Gracilibacillus dipsosauri]PWU70247.1 DUF4479 domain-containing protein [Gracilibacillus dipsosauri]